MRMVFYIAKLAIIILHKGIDLMTYYTDQVYENERILFDQFSTYLPRQFSDFVGEWYRYNLNDSCATYYEGNSGSFQCLRVVLIIF